MPVRYLTRGDNGLMPTGHYFKPHNHVGRPHRVPHQQFKGLAVHHTVTNWNPDDYTGENYGDLQHDIGTAMRALLFSRPDLGPEVPYSFVVFQDPDPNLAWLAEGRGLSFTGAHTAGYNSTVYGVAMYGNYDLRDPTPGMAEAIYTVGTWLADPIGARPTIFHYDVSATACPGGRSFLIRDLVKPPFYPITPEEASALMSQPVISHYAPQVNDPASPWHGRLRCYVFDEESQNLLGYNGADMAWPGVTYGFGLSVLSFRTALPTTHPITHVGVTPDGRNLLCFSKADGGTFPIPMK